MLALHLGPSSISLTDTVKGRMRYWNSSLTRLVQSSLRLPSAFLSPHLLFLGFILGGAAFVRARCVRPLRARRHGTAVRIAFVGNSIQYYYDMPRLMEALCSVRIVQDSCFRSGATLPSLLAEGSSMSDDFGISPHAKCADGSLDVGAPSVPSLLLGARRPWDYCVLNDVTLGPAREATRNASIAALVSEYAPMLRQCGARPILLMNYAYREAVRNDRVDSTDLGDHATLTHRLRDGLDAYAAALAAVLPAAQAPRVAPLGMAMLAVQEERPELWRDLFHPDHRHLSARGAFLQACVLHCTILSSTPPVVADPSALYARARCLGWDAPDASNAPPTVEEASYLTSVAERVVRTPCRAVL